jgi:DNA end-binding protein Ku
MCIKRTRRSFWPEQGKSRENKGGGVSARSIWQGTLIVQKQKIAIKFYSAVFDRQIHFHLLHKRDRTRVEQKMVDAETEKTVPLDQARKAFEVEKGLYVAVTREEVDGTAPEPAREVAVSRFVPMGAIEPQFFDRPYYLGPGEDATVDYFALVRALEKKKCAGIASWTMRKHSYVGALIVAEGYLMMITLRHVEEVIPVNQLDPPQGRALEARERELAVKLIETLSGQFDPTAYKDEYQERVHELIEAKRAGKKVKPKRTRRRPSSGSLADSLRSSLKAASASRKG